MKFNESPYASMSNNPIWLVDLNGADTSFKDQTAKRDFLSALSTVNSKVSSLNTDKDKIIAKGNKKGWSEKKLNKRLSKTQKKLDKWGKLESDFNNIIESDVMFEYSSDVSLMPAANDGEAKIIDYSIVDGEKVISKIRIVAKPGYTQTIVHENRHGNQMLNKSSGFWESSDFNDELEAFRYQSVYDPQSVQRFIKGVRASQYPNYSIQQRESIPYTLKDAIRHAYKGQKAHEEFIDHKW